MRKHFLILMLLALLPLAGFAQFQTGNYVRSGNYIYQIESASDGVNPGTVKLIGIVDGKNPVGDDKVLNLKGKITISLDDEYSVDFYVNDADDNAIKKTYSWNGFATAPTVVGDFAGRVEAESVVIPKEFLKVKENFFYGYTNMKKISFEENSEVTEIESGAFNTTQIRTFDFQNCSKLTTLKEGVFVQTGTAVNSYVTSITLPLQSEALTDISTAFQRLPNLEAINNLDKSLIYKVVANAFSGDTKLKNLALPGTVKIIANGAFAGSGIENLTIDVTSLNDPVGGSDAADLANAAATANPADFTNGNYYATAAYNATNVPADYKTLKTLTLKGTLSGSLTKTAFQHCESLESIDMTNLIINGGTIGASAFEGCKKLSALTFTNGISGIDNTNKAVIGQNAFKDCTKLATVSFGNLQHVTIDANAFENLASDASVTANSAAVNFGTLTDVAINASAFENGTKLGSVSFGAADGLTIESKAFAGLSSATSLTFSTLKDVTIKGSSANGAFYNNTKLSEIVFGASENLNIQTYAFEKAASNLTSATGTLTFGNAKNLQIGVSAFTGATKLQSITFGDITDERADVTTVTEIGKSAFEGATSLKTIEFGKLTGVKIDDSAFLNASSALTGTNVATITFQNDLVSSVIASQAFKGASKVQTITFKNLDASTIQASAFEDVVSALPTLVYGSVTFGNLENGSQIADDAFKGATELNTVTIGDITDSKIGSAGTAAVFPAVKTVTIGAVKSTTDQTLIAANAFAFDNQSGATLILGKDKAALETVATTNEMIAANAFDFTGVTGGTTNFVNPVITIGELKTAKVFAAGALKGNKIAKITFDGNIAAGALDVMIVTGDNSGTADVTKLTELKTLDFNGEIATGGIVANAFATLPAVMTITFNGKLASLAVADGAFEKLVDASQVVYAYNGADIDLTVNPFGKRVFDRTTSISGATTIVAVDAILARTINLSIVNDALKAAFKSSLNGLGTYDGTFAIYKVIYADPVVVDLSFKVYPDIKTSRQHTTTSPRTAWARWELGARVDANVTGTLAANTDLVIKRVQQLDGTNNAKITIYGTYTDEDDALKASTVYMVPLKVTNGYYHIPGTNKTTLIVKVENPANFVETSYKVKVNQTGYDAYNAANNSIWTGLENKELYVASNIMTNQQLIDNLAVDAAATDATGVYGYYHAVNNIDIYRGTYGTTNQKVVENLYIMADPSKNTGFRIDMNPITDQNNAYINKGWYYMLLKKYDDATAARVIWMDDATESDVTAILSAKSDAKNVVNSNAIYTLQGVRVSQMQKGQIYIVNGKKYLAK